MIVYHKANGQAIECRPDPLDGGFLIPANSTEIAPPNHNAETHVPFFNDEIQSWVLVDIEEVLGDDPHNEPIQAQIPATEWLRIQRDNLLANSDWRMNADYPYGNQAEWATYRQTLRDLPQNSTPSYDDNYELLGVIWPTPPTP